MGIERAKPPMDLDSQLPGRNHGFSFACLAPERDKRRRKASAEPHRRRSNAIWGCLDKLLGALRQVNGEPCMEATQQISVTLEEHRAAFSRF